MNNCIICIIMIFLISFFLTLLINDDNIEGLEQNILNVYYDNINNDINPSLAGSIDIPEEKDSNNYKINDEDTYLNLLRNRNEFKEVKKPEIINPKDNKKFFNETFSDYAPYEKILPPIDFAEYKRIQALNSDIISSNMRRDLVNENPDKDCEGLWSDWDESICSPGKMCGVKSRTYKVVKPKSAGGRDCPYKDGEEDHAYCYGETNEGRCGLPTNVCDCDVKNYDEGKCNKDTMNLDCNCPNGYKLSNRGKCIIKTDDLDDLGTVGLSDAEIDTLREIISQYSGSGTHSTQSASGISEFSGANLLTLSALFDYEDRVDREIDEIEQRLGLNTRLGPATTQIDTPATTDISNPSSNDPNSPPPLTQEETELPRDESTGTTNPGQSPSVPPDTIEEVGVTIQAEQSTFS